MQKSIIVKRLYAIIFWLLLAQAAYAEPIPYFIGGGSIWEG